MCACVLPRVILIFPFSLMPKGRRSQGCEFLLSESRRAGGSRK